MDISKLEEFINGEHDRLLKFYKITNKKELRHLIALKLVEEIGELSEELLSLDKIQRIEKLNKHKSEIDDEIADVVITALLLAENLDVNIKRALQAGIKKRKERNY